MQWNSHTLNYTHNRYFIWNYWVLEKLKCVTPNVLSNKLIFCLTSLWTSKIQCGMRPFSFLVSHLKILQWIKQWCHWQCPYILISIFKVHHTSKSLTWSSAHWIVLCKGCCHLKFPVKLQQIMHTSLAFLRENTIGEYFTCRSHWQNLRSYPVGTSNFSTINQRSSFKSTHFSTSFLHFGSNSTCFQCWSLTQHFFYNSFFF